MDEPEPNPAWREYRRRQRWSVGLWLAFLPGTALTGYVGWRLFGSPGWFALMGALWFGAIVVAEIRVLTFRCPRCGQAFFGSWLPGLGNPFARNCIHCGLPKDGG